MAVARGWAGLSGALTLTAALAACTASDGTPDSPPTRPPVATNAAVGDAPSAAASLPPASASSPRTSASSLPTSASSSPTSASSSPTSALVSSRAVSEATFVSPSGNIGCYLDKVVARCDIARTTWQPPPAPSDCELDWGSGVVVDRMQEATFTCAGDTVFGSRDTLAYGGSLRAGDFVCSSHNKEMRCENTKSGHGFTLAVEQYDLF
jgi:hypothetical protein